MEADGELKVEGLGGGMGGEEGMSATTDQRLSQCGRAGVRQLSCPRQLTRWLGMGGVSWKSCQMSGKFQEPAKKKKNQKKQKNRS